MASNCHLVFGVTDFDFPSTFSTTTGNFIPAVVNTSSITSQVRQIETTLKFDRTTKYNQIGDNLVTDTFISNTNTFVLSWVAQADKRKILVTLDGVYVPMYDWTIEYYSDTGTFNYQKKYSRLVLLNDVITTSTSVLRIEYPKSIELYNGTERVLNFYGTHSEELLPQVMSGIEYPGVTFGGRYEGIGLTNLYGGSTPDTYSDGGTWTNGILINAQGINPEDIIVEGQYPFVTPFTSYAPEEQVPGYTVDSVGINVYTKTTSTGGPTIISGTANISISGQNNYINIPVLPTTVDSITVSYNNQIMTYVTSFTRITELEFTIDWANSQIVIPAQTYPGNLAYSIIGVGGGAPGGYGTVDKVTLSIDVTPDTTSTVQLVSLGTTSTTTQNNINPAGALVTVNGQFISQGYSSDATYFLLTYTNENNHSGGGCI